jgi:hypothetical protein
MAVDTAEDRTTESAQPPTPGAGRYYSRRILRALLDVIELEVQIIVLRILSAMRDAAVRVCMGAAAIILGLAGVVFLEIAIFQAVEHLLPIAWVFLIFAIVHLAVAGGLAFMAARPMRSKASSTPDKSDAPNKIGGHQK